MFMTRKAAREYTRIESIKQFRDWRKRWTVDVQREVFQTLEVNVFCYKCMQIGNLSNSTLHKAGYMFQCPSCSRKTYLTVTNLVDQFNLTKMDIKLYQQQREG